MSSSQHPIALRLERLVGGEATLLATVMGLPLVDGIFPALVLAGALSDPAGVVEVGLLIFGGSATLAVILAEMRVSPRQGARAVLLVGTVLIVGAAVEAALAPTIRSVVDLHTFERAAALVIAAIAAKTASARIGEYLPSPGVIVGIGLIASLDPAGARLVVTPDPVLVGKAAAAAAVGTAFALAVALLGPRLRGIVDVDRFRFASAVALGLLPLSILGVDLGQAPLLVVAVAGLLAYDPDGTDDAVDASPAGAAGGDGVPADAMPPADVSDVPVPAAVADGGDADPAGPLRLAPGDYGESAAVDPGADGDDADDPAGGDASRVRTTDGERAPWL